MPTDRRIPFSTFVVATKLVEMEETAIKHREFIDSPGKTLGGKGIAPLAAVQWGDAWSFGVHPLLRVWEEFTVNWEDVLIYPNAYESIYTVTTTGSDHQLTSDSNDLAFLYIKNTGDTNNCLVSLNGSGGNYYIIIPPNGSVHLRGDGTTLECNEVYVKSSSSTTTIEFLIAKEA